MSAADQIQPPPPDVPPLYPSSNGHVLQEILAQREPPVSLWKTDKTAEKPSKNTTNVKEQLVTIHEELEELRQRRQQLEEKRIRLLAAALPPSRHASQLDERSATAVSQKHNAKREKGTPTQTSLQQNTSITYSRRSNTSASRTTSATRRHPFSASNVSNRSGNDAFIPSENVRRQNLQTDPYFQLKEAMKKATEEDTMCMIGSFLLEDNSKVYTFGRERRFRPLVGQNGKYYLSTDVEVAQNAKHQLQRSRSAGFVRPAYSGTPGPGAYTPRYSKMSKPSILTLYQ